MLLRSLITAHTCTPEPSCVAALLPFATLSVPAAARAQAVAERLVLALRRKGSRNLVEGLVREYSLSSQEGVALMCLAEALLRIPDVATRQALIRDKIGGGDWRAHLGHPGQLFVNAATWGLLLTGKLSAPSGQAGLASALTRLIARGGEPVIRRAVDLAMRMMGEQFVMGETIERALARSRRLEARGFSYSYDMLGEAATTAEDAARYYRDYEAAIHAIGAAAAGRGVHAGPGISIKLSALHPRYGRAQRARVMAELLPRMAALARLCRGYDIGLNIDAEEAERLELSLDLFAPLCADADLAGWDGLGFVVQAYQKRAPFVIDLLIDLARRSGHRLMIRLVKGAYWDSEIKRAQIEGLPDYPVFTRKLHTDLSYLACARKLLDVRDAVFPQFATHNAQTVAAIHEMAGTDFRFGDWEFQCLHGMGEALYEEVVGPDRLDRPCRIYAPVGTHETLLAYLVRRLLENGANSSFVNRIHDPAVPVAELVADPVAQVRAGRPVGAPHPWIPLPRDLYGADLQGVGRPNAVGFDLGNEDQLSALEAAVADAAGRDWSAAGEGLGREVRNPADLGDVVGRVHDVTPAQIDQALARAAAAAGAWAATSAAARADLLARAADLLEARMLPLVGLLVREAGKTMPPAIAEVREAVDFLRYYGGRAREALDASSVPLGPVVCISPWNFPLAIFLGQVAAALAAGNPVLAKPAEETPLIAAQAVAILHEAGMPEDVVQLLPGDGEVGAALVGDARTRGVMFTGSGMVAKLIQAQLAQRLNPDGAPVPLIAETGGQNAMIVDSSALAEQVVRDVLVSAFDSAGQRCSALRILCVQDDVADRLLVMLRGALAELTIGDPRRLATDVGPVITTEAQTSVIRHIAAMRARGCAVHQAALPAASALGHFVAPAIIEICGIGALEHEVFGPVLHVLRFARDDMEAVVDAVNATGFGLTFGVHSRLDDTIAKLTARAQAGNVYVNRNIVGAVVGVQPFGGRGLSGTGPKAGGPLILRRLLAAGPPATGLPQAALPAPAQAWLAWLGEAGPGTTPVGAELALAGPAGEQNFFRTEARGDVLCVAEERSALLRGVTAALATGNRVLVGGGAADGLTGLPASLDGWVAPWVGGRLPDVQAILADGPDEALRLAQASAREHAAVVPLFRSDRPILLENLIWERSVSVNTAAAGGNADIMMIGDDVADIEMLGESL